jgi:membrane associated rhomboid family serine protease
MIFPIGDDQIQGGAYPIVSYSFLAVNIMMFLFQVTLGPSELSAFFERYSTIPTYISEGHHLGTLLTNMFLHGSIMHLLGNMVFLWIFADNIEATIGSIPFMVFYLLGGMIASLAHVYFNLDSSIPSLGASGAISAVMGAYMVMFPRSRITVFVFLVIILRKVSMSALMFLGIWIGIQVVSTVQSLNVISSDGGTAWFAHLGGLAFGLLIGLGFRRQARLMELSS